jgi:hypothetical protein
MHTMRRPTMPDRAAIVTGASRGIGLALAEVLGEEGYGLTISSRKADSLEKTADALRAKGFDVEHAAGTMADEEAIQAVVARHRERFGRLDVLVNSAGAEGASRDWMSVPLLPRGGRPVRLVSATRDDGEALLLEQSGVGRACDCPLDAVGGELRERLLGRSPSALISDSRGHDGEWPPAETLDGLGLVEEVWQLREVRPVGT